MEPTSGESGDGFLTKKESSHSLRTPTLPNPPNCSCRDHSNSHHHHALEGNPLLGPEELDSALPNRKLIVQVTTWNMGSLPLPKEFHLRKLFFHDEPALPPIDLHIVAIQECWPETEAVELELQLCLGSTFVLFTSSTFGTLHESIFIRRDLVWFTGEPSESTISVRSGRLFKTKGATVISFSFFGTKFSFVTAHLSAGAAGDRERTRIEELKKIIGSVRTPNDVLFLGGDLNFRISYLKRDSIISKLKSTELPTILEKDELNQIFSRKENFHKFLDGFYEAAAITFKPTYKYDLGTDSFDTSNKKRSPAYTDRIMYKSKKDGIGRDPVVCLAYDSIQNMRVSDHRPVYAVFSVDIKPGCDTMAMSGGKYKRELYVKAVQKRAKYLMERRKKLASAVCLIS